MYSLGIITDNKKKSLLIKIKFISPPLDTPPWDICHLETTVPSKPLPSVCSKHYCFKDNSVMNTWQKSIFFYQQSKMELFFGKKTHSFAYLDLFCIKIILHKLLYFANYVFILIYIPCLIIYSWQIRLVYSKMIDLTKTDRKVCKIQYSS